MTDQDLDVLMKRVLVDAMKLDLEAATKDDTASFAPSPKHQRQMKAMLKDPLGWSRKKARPVWKTIAQRAAIILLAISLAFGTIMAASPTARAAFARWVRELYDTHVTYRYAGEDIPGILPRYRISGLPEGYYEYDRAGTTNTTSITYQNDDHGGWISLTYIYMQQGSAVDFVVDNSEIVPITVNGMAGEFYLSPNLDEVYNTVTWIDKEANLQFIVDAPLELDDTLRIAESVILENPEK